MKLDEIFKLWAEDAEVDRQDLGEEALKISKLHHKYHQIFTYEKLTLRKLEVEFKTLKQDKHEFYTEGPTKETQLKGWNLPPRGKVLKADVSTYIEADKDIIDLTLRIGIQHEKITLLESILKTIQNRGYNLRAAIDWVRYTNGG